MTTRLLRPSAFALLALAAFATAQPGWTQTLAGRPDRYGFADPTVSPVAAGVSGAAQLRTRYLSWPGKVMRAAPPVLRTGFAAPPEPSPSRAAWRSARSDSVGLREPARIGPAQPPLWNPPAVAPQAYASERKAWVRPGPEAPARRAPDISARQAPSSIYDVPEPMGGDPRDETANTFAPALRGRGPVSAQSQTAPPASRTQQAAFASPPHLRPANGQGVRFYSVHRPFGLQPDPAPIPPQFFAATPDLSDPPGPSPNRKVAAGTGASTIAARSAAQAQDGEAAAQP